MRKLENKNDDSFDVKTIGKIGERKYFLNLQYDQATFEREGKLCLLLDRTKIQQATIYKIIYKSDVPVIVEAIKEDGERISCVQDMFFQTYEDALDAINRIEEEYKKEKRCANLYEMFENCIDVKYMYKLEFSVERFDILLGQKCHNTIQDIEVTIEPNKYQWKVNPTREKVYVAGKKIISSTDELKFEFSKL